MANNLLTVGTVITSVLDYDHFSKLNGDPLVIDTKVSAWVPADGRDIPNSVLAGLTGQTKAPDLRGRFLRGLNTIYNIGQPTLIISTADEDDPSSNRKPGEFQGDSFRNHAHAASGHINGSVCGSNGTHDVDGGGSKWNCDPNFGDHNVIVSIQPFGSSETRPKNVSVYYYIKIN